MHFKVHITDENGAHIITHVVDNEKDWPPRKSFTIPLTRLLMGARELIVSYDFDELSETEEAQIEVNRTILDDIIKVKTELRNLIGLYQSHVHPETPGLLRRVEVLETRVANGEPPWRDAEPTGPPWMRAE